MTHVQLRRLIAAIVGIALLIAAIVGVALLRERSDSSAASRQSTATASLAHVDWAAVIDDLDCSGINRGVEVNDVRYADVTGDGTEEAFVWVDCVHPTSGWPWVLEVFDGSSDPRDPKRIGVLIGEEENLRDGKLTFSGNTVTVEGAEFDEQDPNCCPSLRFRQSFTWLGNGFKAGERTVRKAQQEE